MASIDHNFDMQAIVAEQIASITLSNEVRAGFSFQRGLPAGYCAIQKRTHCCDHGIPAQLIIAALPGRCRIERVGAVIGVIEAAPTRIGGIEQEPGVEHRHHQLRPSHGRDLGIDVLRADLKRRGFRNEVADFSQEHLILSLIDRFSGAGEMPCVDLRLQLVAFGQQRAVYRHKPVEQRGKTAPEPGSILAQRCQHFALDKTSQRCIDLKAGLLNPFAHEFSHLGTGRAKRDRLDFQRFRGGMPAPMPQPRRQCNAI